MLGYIEYLGVPIKIALVLAVVFFVMQGIGELIEFKGKIAPEFLKVRKYFSRKKIERETMRDIPQTLVAVQKSLDIMNAHYDPDSIKLRNDWMKLVNDKLESHDNLASELTAKLDKNNRDTLSLLIDSKRNTIISFASYVTGENNPVTREQFNRTFKLYEEYEAIIESNGLTNGEMDVAIRIIKESYENHMRSHSFIEDIRGYTNIG